MFHSRHQFGLAFTLAGLLWCALSAGAAVAADIAPGTVHEGDLESRNNAISIGDDARVEGNISARNGSVRIGDRVSAGDIETRNGGVRTGIGGEFGRVESRNGSIVLGADSRAAELESRNGALRIGASSRIGGSTSTRNGKIELDPNVQVAGSLEARNGSISLANGVSVQGEAKTRNGQIQMDQAMVKQNVSSQSGDLLIHNGSRVDGDVIIDISEQSGERRWFGFGGNRYPDAGNIEILGGSVVGGNIIVRLPEDYDRDIPTVTIDSESQVNGEIMVDERVEVIRVD